MYIRLTRLDSSPIWLNAAFVVTVEPRRGGGSIVVPIGDGLDYEVRETAEAVLAMLEGTPPAAVVPVPAPKGLAPAPADVSPAAGFDDLATPPPASVPPPAPEAETTASDGRKAARRTRRTKKAEADGEPDEADADAVRPKPARKPRAKAKKPEVDFPDEQVERLRKMMPGSLRKLVNTLVTQFKVSDGESVVALLQSRGVISVDREHVVWNA